MVLKQAWYIFERTVTKRNDQKARMLHRTPQELVSKSVRLRGLFLALQQS